MSIVTEGSPSASRRLARPRRFDGRKLGPTIGFELSDVSLSEEFSDGEIEGLRRMLCEHKVLVFRSQHSLTPAQHVAFARRFGELEVHPIISRHPDHPELVTFVHNSGNRGVENVYHSDTSFYPSPSMGSVLRCVSCPPVGGDTIFSDMVAAYASLSEPVKAKIASLFAMHDASVAFCNRYPSAQDRAQLRSELPPVEHPVVRTHPETNEKILFVNELFTTHFSNFRQANGGVYNQDAPTQSHELFAHLIRQARHPEFQVRIRWEPDTVVFWDNRAVQHYAVSDYYPHERSMMRATIVGDAPR